MEGLIFGGAYLRREICVSKSIGLACSGKEIYHFCFVLLCIRGQIPSTRPPGDLYSEGRFNGGFFALRDWGAYTQRGLFSEFYGILRYMPIRCHFLPFEITVNGNTAPKIIEGQWSDAKRVKIAEKSQKEK